MANPNDWLTPPVIASISGALIAIIGSFAAGVVLVINAIRQVQISTAKIEGHVNSEKTAAEGRENALKREVEMLREMLVEKRVTAALLAQAATLKKVDIASEPAQQ